VIGEAHRAINLAYSISAALVVNAMNGKPSSGSADTQAAGSVQVLNEES
jgi:hypothetical protein